MLGKSVFDFATSFTKTRSKSGAAVVIGLSWLGRAAKLSASVANLNKTIRSSYVRRERRAVGP
jgi:hypothetical protein